VKVVPILMQVAAEKLPQLRETTGYLLGTLTT
jgi:hypothetical protein